MRTHAVGIVKFLANNRLFSLAVALALFAGGMALASASLLIAAGILAYGWPILHVYFKDVPETVDPAPASAEPLEVMRPGLADAR